MYFTFESLSSHTMSPNLDLSFDNPIVLQMLMLHNTLCEAYPPNCIVGYYTSCDRMDYGQRMH